MSFSKIIEEMRLHEATNQDRYVECNEVVSQLTEVFVSMLTTDLLLAREIITSLINERIGSKKR